MLVRYTHLPSTVTLNNGNSEIICDNIQYISSTSSSVLEQELLLTLHAHTCIQLLVQSIYQQSSVLVTLCQQTFN